MEDKIIIAVLAAMVVILFCREIKRQMDVDDGKTPMSRRQARKIIKMLKQQEEDMNRQHRFYDSRDKFLLSLNDRVESLANVVEPIVKMLGAITENKKDDNE